MTEPRKGGRPRGASFPHKVWGYLDEEGMTLFDELTRLRGVSDSGLIRVLVREEADRRGLNQPDKAAATG